jgi:cobyrinic acid a,c-diamide synthase
MIHTPRIVIAGTHSGVGKTSIATALMAAFARRGLRVQPFKIGPDFIDPGFQQAACGRVSRNLDGWMLSQDANLQIFERASADADLAIVEGVMGLFDGRSASADQGSTAEMAKCLRAPVLLVVDASAMARSAAALVHGFETFDADLELAGVLFNRIGGARHADLLRESVAAYCRSTAFGFLPRNEKIALPGRHLGLTMAAEALTPECLSEMVAWVESHIDLDALLALAHDRSPALTTWPAPQVRPAGSKVRIAVARDSAFCFYYQDNLDLLTEFGAQLVEFSPMSDRELPPEIGGIYLGGGYPELHAAQLSENRAMIEAIRRFARAGAPMYAECGGFMYLTEAVVDLDGSEHPMAGLFPTRARMQSRLAALGYIQLESVDAGLWLKSGETLRGHQFRYSAIDAMPSEVCRVYQSPAEGYRIHSVLGSYIHLHFLSCPGFAERFVDHCAQWHAQWCAMAHTDVI